MKGQNGCGTTFLGSRAIRKVRARWLNSHKGTKTLTGFFATSYS